MQKYIINELAKQIIADKIIRDKLIIVDANEEGIFYKN